MNIRLIVVDIVCIAIIGWCCKREWDNYQIGKRYRPADNGINTFVLAMIVVVELINIAMLIADLYQIKYATIGLIVATIGYFGMAMYRSYTRNRW